MRRARRGFERPRRPKRETNLICWRATRAWPSDRERGRDEGAARSDARVARGVDGLLAVCVKLARDLAEDELARPNGEYYSDEELDDVYSKSG